MSIHYLEYNDNDIYTTKYTTNQLHPPKIPSTIFILSNVVATTPRNNPPTNKYALATNYSPRKY